jgi:hypothetical protein
MDVWDGSPDTQPGINEDFYMNMDFGERGVEAVRLEIVDVLSREREKVEDWTQEIPVATVLQNLEWGWDRKDFRPVLEPRRS